MYMQFFLPMQPPTTTHNAKQLHAYMKGGQPHAVLHDSPELKQIVEKFWSDPCGVFGRVEEL